MKKVKTRENTFTSKCLKCGSTFVGNIGCDNWQYYNCDYP